MTRLCRCGRMTKSRPPILFNRIADREINVAEKSQNLSPERVQLNSYRTATAPQRMDLLAIFITEIMFE
jgi:hypothetical protein